MVHAEETIFIDRAPAAVFAAVSDPGVMPLWRSNLAEVAWVDGAAPGVGHANLRAVTRVMGMRFEWTCDVTAWDPPAHFAYVARNGRYTVDVAFTCAPEDHGTLLTMRGGGEIPGGRVGGLAAPLFVQQLQRDNRKSLHALKQLLEGASQ
jgi:uncharacterized protein YndB with AHSA1/START domain